MSNVKLSDSEVSAANSDVSDAVCPTCDVLFSTDCTRWVCCDGCGDWYHVNCTYLKGKGGFLNIFCEDCVNSDCGMCVCGSLCSCVL